MIVVGGGTQPSHCEEPAFLHAVFAQQLHPETPVSLDGGRSWVPALQAARWLHARGDNGLAAVVPMHVEGWSMGAGYLAIFSLLFFGGPIVFGTTFAAFDDGPKLLVRLGAVLVGIVLGPLPIAFMGWRGLVNIRRTPTYRGKGRAIFALVVAGVMALPCAVGLVAALIPR